jgi:hypothetical protein
MHEPSRPTQDCARYTTLNYRLADLKEIIGKLTVNGRR